jgi:hypothetical protein
LASFDGASYETQIGWLGATQAVSPPDPQVAAGKSAVVEMTNDVASIWTKSGTLMATTDLNSLFPVPAQYRVSDPSLQYSAGRWYASAFAFDVNLNSQAYLAVSAIDDPMNWYTYTIKQNTASMAYDQPRIGVSHGGQVTMVWEDYNCAQYSCPFAGEEIWVLNAEGPGRPMRYLWAWSTPYPDTSRWGSIPTQMLSLTDDQVLVANESDSNLFRFSGTPHLRLTTVTGSPADPSSYVRLTDQIVALSPTSIPPDAAQPGGGRLVNTGDDRFHSSVRQNGSLWVAAGVDCVPTGDAADRACLRLFRLNATLGIDQDITVGQAGSDLYYPALTLDQAGNLFVVYNKSSATAAAGVYANIYPFANPTVPLGETLLRAGTGTYDCSFCGAANRWGDYSGASQDGGNPTDVWLAGEYAAATQDRQNWGTSLSRMTVSPPQIKAITPMAGPTAGGTAITVTAADLIPGSTSVSFGSVPMTSFAVQSPDQLTLTSPAGSAGPVQLTVSTPNGSSAATPSGKFTYMEPPAISGVSPSSGPGNGTLQVTISGTHLSPLDHVAFGTTAPYSVLSATDTKIVAVAPAHDGGLVDVAVTTAGGTSGIVAADHFTFDQPNPQITSLYPSPPTGGPAGDTQVIVYGSGLSAATSVRFGDVSVTSFTASPTQLSVQSPPHAPGTVDVRIVSGNTMSPIVAGDQFTYANIVVTSVSPSSGPPAGSTVLTVSGTGFGAPGPGYTPGVLFQGSPVPVSSWSDTQVTVSDPPAHFLGDARMQVCSYSNGCAAPTSAFTYAVTMILSPTAGAFGTAVTLTGNDVNLIKSVQFGDVATTFSVVAGQILTTAPPLPAGTVPVSVDIGDGSHRQTIGRFTYVASSPKVTTMSAHYSPSWGGQLVLITGTGLSYATDVKFGTVSARAIHRDSDTQLTTLSPPQPAGTVDVTVVGSGGTSPIVAADQLTYSDCVSPRATASEFVVGAPCLAISRYQYGLNDSDGVTWRNIDPFRLRLMLSPTADATYVVGGNADLWTADAGVNQDLAIALDGQVIAWKESGGFAGTFSPNAAFVQTVIHLPANSTHVLTLQWKANHPAPGTTIVVGAGPAGQHSPTRLSAELVSGANTNVRSATITTQPSLTGNDGQSWQDLGAGLTFSYQPSTNGTALLSGNADLWTAVAGYNQDIGINVIDTASPCTGCQPVAWKESGGFAGTYSPNAAFVQGIYPMTAGHIYQIKLQWKTNKPGPGTILAGAGPIGGLYSPTQLALIFYPGGTITNPIDRESRVQYALTDNQGADTSWVPVDQATLQLSISSSTPCVAILSANADLWTSSAGYNQDIGIAVDLTVVTWKESGGFAGTYSPNAAFTQGTIAIEPGHTYVVMLVWKANIHDPGTIWAGAGPIAGRYSPTRLTAQLAGCS